MKQQGAAFIEAPPARSLETDLAFTNKESEALQGLYPAPLNAKTLQLQQVDADEILFKCIDLRPGQSLRIRAEREHMPQVLRLAERAYQNGTTLIDLDITEPVALDLKIPMYQYLSNEALSEKPLDIGPMFKEGVEKNTARIWLKGINPEQYKGLDVSRIQTHTRAMNLEKAPYLDDFYTTQPWTIYYLPATEGAKASGYDTLDQALSEAQKITRTGKLKAHFNQLMQLKDKMNALVAEGYQELHFQSLDEAGNPDGKTDLYVTLTPQSEFHAGQAITTRGQRTYPNVPSEEMYTSPDARKTRGVVTATMPFTVNGNLVENLRLEFDETGLVARDSAGRHKISATKNEAVFRDLLEKNAADGGDRLGEVALVAGSPIFDLGRVFKNTLIDENATCHLAIGSGFTETIKGALDLKDDAAQKDYLKQLGVNPANVPVHVDFMIGGPNVLVTAKKPGSNEPRITLIKDNAFQI